MTTPHQSGAPLVGERVIQIYGLRASVPFFPLPYPLLSTFCSRPIFSAARRNAKNAFAQPEFRWPRTGTLATQASLLKVFIRNFRVVAGIPLCQNTFQYTSCILRKTGGILGGMWKVCIRNFTVLLRFLLVQATCQYTVCILGESRGLLNVVWKESIPSSYILWIMSPGFQLNVIFINFLIPFLLIFYPTNFST